MLLLISPFICMLGFECFYMKKTKTKNTLDWVGSGAALMEMITWGKAASKPLRLEDYTAVGFLNNSFTVLTVRTMSAVPQQIASNAVLLNSSLALNFTASKELILQKCKMYHRQCGQTSSPKSSSLLVQYTNCTSLSAVFTLAPSPSAEQRVQRTSIKV